MKEQNYGADWGDYVSFVKDMRAKARAYDVDLLLIDSGVCGDEKCAPSKADCELDRIYMMALA